MAQKDKVKELVGRGLDSYHTKSLQQIDRIEKKNKEQNHKISILSNELDNDYLTKTEEGSVISLDHSKEGMVYIDSLEGNTLVNYCTDGSKELTLNGDIDLEGTFVTTTEGVDNGKVDVMCEGNTLVNLIKYDAGSYYPTYAWEIGETYTMIVEFTSNAECQLYIEENITWAKLSPITNGVKVGYNKFVVKLTIPSNYTGLEKINITNRVNGIYNSNVKFTDIKPIVLKGDWTNKEIPQSHFEGMKSVGQDDENGHKIEILSRNDKLIINKDKLLNEGIFYGTKGWSAVRLVTKAKRVKIVVTNKDGLARQTKLSVKNDIESEVRARKLFGMNETFNKVEIDYELLDTNILSFCVYGENDFNGDFFDYYDIEVFSYDNIEDVTPTTRYNKKEILLNEPLRSIENINKDRIVKIGNKLFIERNLAQITLDGTENWIKWSYETPLTQLDTHLHCTIRIANIKYYSKECANIVTDKFKSVSTRGTLGEYIYHDGWNDTICIKILQSKLETPDASGFKKWLQNNPIELIYELATPIYEPLEIEPTLNTYTDITHISNNSLIPCNMKVKNSGYNAIIKPSTLYTITLDTNKSGTIGMNLGGAKGTTTNNVLTLTTPATLTDDSLRLHGKGIKGSKIRLLEGDKTNWMPSFFEGMKSSFEDKLQDDGTYKMEILSNNKNLFDIDKTYYKAGWGEQNYQKYKNGFSFCSKNGWNSIGYAFESLKNKTVTVCATVTCVNKDTSKQQEQHFSIIPVEYGYPTSVIFRDGETKKVKFNITLKDNGRVYFIGASNNEGSNKGGIQWFLEDISVVEGIENDYVPRECNKIQFSSIEPLRSVDDVKDRFVFKDGKLMIERNCGTGSLDGTASIYHCWTNNRNDIVSGYIYYNEHKPEITNIKQHSNVVCTDLPNNRGGHISTVEGFRNTSYFTFSIHKSKLGIEDINAGEVNQNIVKRYFTEHPLNFVYQLAEPTYEEIPYELQKIILEGYENGTLFLDTNIPPTVTTTYAGETPIVRSVKLNKTEVLNNTTDINDNIIPYLMDMDYRVVCLELATETQGISMARLFGGVYEMLKRDILSGRLSKEEYGYRLADYFNAGKLTEEQVRELEDLR